MKAFYRQEVELFPDEDPVDPELRAAQADPVPPAAAAFIRKQVDEAIAAGKLDPDKRREKIAEHTPIDGRVDHRPQRPDDADIAVWREMLDYLTPLRPSEVDIDDSRYDDVPYVHMFEDLYEYTTLQRLIDGNGPRITFDATVDPDIPIGTDTVTVRLSDRGASLEATSDHADPAEIKLDYLDAFYNVGEPTSKLSLGAPAADTIAAWETGLWHDTNAERAEEAGEDPHPFIDARNAYSAAGTIASLDARSEEFRALGIAPVRIEDTDVDGYGDLIDYALTNGRGTLRFTVEHADTGTELHADALNPSYAGEDLTTPNYVLGLQEDGRDLLPRLYHDATDI